MESQTCLVKPVLYSYFRSSSCWRVRIALALKDIDYEYKSCERLLVEGPQRIEYMKLNPMGEVPTLIIDGNTLTQSLAIIEYLEETRPGISLLPKDPILKAKARALTEIINSGIQPLQNVRVQRKSGDSGWSKFWIERGFTVIRRQVSLTFSKRILDQFLHHGQCISLWMAYRRVIHIKQISREILEKVLQDTAGTFSMGDEISLPDLYITPQVYRANRVNVDMSKFPTISRVDSALSKIEAFQAAHPSRQPDCPFEERSSS